MSDLQRDIAEVDFLVAEFAGIEIIAAWQRIRARLTPDRERVARALAAHSGWDGWDTARDCRDTPSGNDPEDEREYWRGMADAAIKAMEGNDGHA